LRTLITILSKVITLEFYRSNAAFFLIAIGLCFGFMSGVEHQALAEFFISSPVVLLIPISIWIIYSVKVIQFNKKIFNANENEFLFNLQVVNKNTQYIALFIVALEELLPIVIYSIFLMITAMKYIQYLMITYTFFSVLMLIIISAAMLIRNLHRPGIEEKETKINQFLNTRFNRHNLQFFFEWVVRNDLITVTGAKFFACILLIGTLKLYAMDVYDWRLMGIGVSIAMMGNVVLIFKYQFFQEKYLSITRNLPLSLSNRMVQFIMTFLILCLPEFGILVSNFPVNLTKYELIYTVLFCFGILIGLYSSLYIKHINLDRAVKGCFIGVITLITLILFNVNLLIIVLTLIIGGIIIFKNYYYSFELVAESNPSYLKSSNDSSIENYGIN
jgi:hypothetical protein